MAGNTVIAAKASGNYVRRGEDAVYAKRLSQSPVTSRSHDAEDCQWAYESMDAFAAEFRASTDAI
jgi:hypothetical protein